MVNGINEFEFDEKQKEVNRYIRKAVGENGLSLLAHDYDLRHEVRYMIDTTDDKEKLAAKLKTLIEDKVPYLKPQTIKLNLQTAEAAFPLERLKEIYLSKHVEQGKFVEGAPVPPDFYSFINVIGVQIRRNYVIDATLAKLGLSEGDIKTVHDTADNFTGPKFSEKAMSFVETLKGKPNGQSHTNGIG